MHRAGSEDFQIVLEQENVLAYCFIIFRSSVGSRYQVRLVPSLMGPFCEAAGGTTFKQS
jgi:hypothetical protein